MILLALFYFNYLFSFKINAYHIFWKIESLAGHKLVYAGP